MKHLKTFDDFFTNTDRTPQNEADVLSIKYKLLLGGLGAILPATLLFIKKDLVAFYSSIDTAVVLGGLSYSFILFALGMMVILKYRKVEHDPWKLIQLGMAAPTLLAITQQEVNVHVSNKEKNITSQELQNTEKDASSTESSLLLTFFPSAHAQTVLPQDPVIITQPVQPQLVKLPKGFEKKVGNFQLPEETLAEQFLRGFHGSLPKNRFYVVQSSQATALEAYQEKLNLESQGLKDVAIYRSSNANLPYRIVLGEQLNYEQATQLSDHLSTQEGVGNMLIEVGE